MSDDLSATMEDYLEAILGLVEENAVARVTDVAERLDVSKPRVTVAVKRLAREGFVRHEAYGHIELTSGGARAARQVHERHRLLEHFFRHVLGLDPEQAGEDACLAEHCLSPETVERLTRFVRFVDRCPRTGAQWLRRFRCRCGGGRARMEQPACRAACLEECAREVGSARSGACPGQ